MVMPPHFTGVPPEGPLEDNCFRLEGYTLGIGTFTVTEVESGVACAVEVACRSRRQIAERWKRQGPPYPPGAVQTRSAVEVHFTPAVPGRRYRCDCAAGSVEREYQGPPLG